VSSTPALRLVLTTLPNAEIAGRLAHELVEARLAACVNVLSPCSSIYRWQDAVQEDGEIPLIIKTTAERYAALETFLRENHPYQVPEIIAIDVNDGLPDYLRWAAAATQP
jgi:periplasmic divalent cation tolerance protein